jgi:hypothetical protein
VQLVQAVVAQRKQLREPRTKMRQGVLELEWRWEKEPQRSGHSLEVA